MDIKNPKFNFTQEQTLKILEAANYINKAADSLIDINGMLTSLLNSMSLDLLDQIGLTESLMEKLETRPNLEITEAEKAEIDSLIAELNATESNTKE